MRRYGGPGRFESSLIYLGGLAQGAGKVARIDPIELFGSAPRTFSPENERLRSQITGALRYVEDHIDDDFLKDILATALTSAGGKTLTAVSFARNPAHD